MAEFYEAGSRFFIRSWYLEAGDEEVAILREDSRGKLGVLGEDGFDFLELKKIPDDDLVGGYRHEEIPHLVDLESGDLGPVTSQDLQALAIGREDPDGVLWGGHRELATVPV